MGVLLSELAARFGGEVAGDDVRVGDVASLASAGAGDLAFYAGGAHRPALSKTSAGAVVLRLADAAQTGLPKWVVKGDPRLFFSRAAVVLRPPPADIVGVAKTACLHPSAVVAADAAIGEGAVVGAGARIGARCRVHAGAIVGEGVVIGEGTTLHPRVVLCSGARVGARCVLHAGAVIGADGFGYAESGGGREKIPHFAGVIVGDDVEIGANSAVDRGMLDDTVIGDGVKIDNLAQIGHNVYIGKNSVICGNVGIAGGAVVGAGCVIGGGAGVAGGVVIGDGARIGGHSAVTRDAPPGADVLGVWPALSARRWRRLVGALRRLAEGRPRAVR